MNPPPAQFECCVPGSGIDPDCQQELLVHVGKTPPFLSVFASGEMVAPMSLDAACLAHVLTSYDEFHQARPRFSKSADSERDDPLVAVGDRGTRTSKETTVKCVRTSTDRSREQNLYRGSPTATPLPPEAVLCLREGAPEPS